MTISRALYFAIFSWILSGIFAAAVFPYVHNVVGVVLATKIYVLTLLPIFCFLIIVILTLNIKTWKTVACRGNCVASLNRQNGNMAKKSQNRADKTTLENERRFSKVVLLLLLNLVFLVLPQVLLNVVGCVNIWCQSCITEFGSLKVSLLQFYLFPLFLSQLPYFTLYLFQSTGNHVAVSSFVHNWKGTVDSTELSHVNVMLDDEIQKVYFSSTFILDKNLPLLELCCY